MFKIEYSVWRPSNHIRYVLILCSLTLEKQVTGYSSSCGTCDSRIGSLIRYDWFRGFLSIFGVSYSLGLPPSPWFPSRCPPPRILLPIVLVRCQPLDHILDDCKYCRFYEEKCLDVCVSTWQLGSWRVFSDIPNICDSCRTGTMPLLLLETS